MEILVLICICMIMYLIWLNQKLLRAETLASNALTKYRPTGFEQYFFFFHSIFFLKLQLVSYFVSRVGEEHSCHRVRVKARGQFGGVSSLLPLCGIELRRSGSVASALTC